MLLHRSLTVLLAGAYLLIVGVVAKSAGVLGLDSELPLGALFILVALVFLALTLVSDRVRNYTARFVSQHLRRPHYDYRQVWRTFTECTAAHVRQGDFCAAVTRWIAENLNVLSVTLWLVDSSRQRLVFGASTALSEETAEGLLRGQPDAWTLIGRLAKRAEPIDVEQSKEDWARELSLRVAGQSVGRINALIGTLSELRQGLELQRVETDIGEVVRTACAAVEATRGVKLALDLQAVPKVSIDPEQITKVITNLLLNAIDAIGPAGRVSVSTFAANQWAVLTVADNGCGMRPVFIRRQLFRPFQTTKKKGIGVGMYHSKTGGLHHHPQGGQLRCAP